MKFIINDLKYDTDKMEKIADVKKWYATNNALIKAMYSGREVGYVYNCELWKSKKGNYLLTHDQDYRHIGEAISEEEAMKLIRKYDLIKYEEMFGEIEEA